MMEAVACLKREGVGEYLEMANQTVRVFIGQGQVNQAARLRKDVAEVLEEQYELESASAEYEKAAEYYELDESPSFSNQCLLKSADIQVQCKSPDFVKAITMYEKVVRDYQKKDLLRSSCKDLFMKITMCYLSNDDNIGAKKAFDKACNEDPSFDNGREGELIQVILDSLDNGDEATLEKHVGKYNKITPFDKPKSALLIRIKDLFQGARGDID